LTEDIPVFVKEQGGSQPLQVDYFLTRSQNAVNDHQNNLLLSTGVAFRWPHAK
jgi:hypothetical protein